jgi:hypothetical protein
MEIIPGKREAERNRESGSGKIKTTKPEVWTEKAL